MLAKIGGWRTLLTGSVADGRQLLREVLDGKLVFTPDGRTYKFEADVATERIVGEVLPQAETREPQRGVPGQN